MSEIRKEADSYNKRAYSGHFAGEEPAYHFRMGAEWMKEQLQLQNNECECEEVALVRHALRCRKCGKITEQQISYHNFEGDV